MKKEVKRYNRFKLGIMKQKSKVIMIMMIKIKGVERKVEGAQYKDN